MDERIETRLDVRIGEMRLVSLVLPLRVILVLTEETARAALALLVEPSRRRSGPMRSGRWWTGWSAAIGRQARRSRSGSFA